MTSSGRPDLDKRRGHRPRLAAPGAGRRPVLTLADRLLAAVLHQRLALPQVAIAALFGVRPETINRRIRDIRQLLDQAGHTIQPGPHRLASLDDLYSLAIARASPFQQRSRQRVNNLQALKSLCGGQEVRTGGPLRVMRTRSRAVRIPGGLRPPLRVACVPFRSAGHSPLRQAMMVMRQQAATSPRPD